MARADQDEPSPPRVMLTRYWRPSVVVTPMSLLVMPYCETVNPEPDHWPETKVEKIAKEVEI